MYGYSSRLLSSASGPSSGVRFGSWRRFGGSLPPALVAALPPIETSCTYSRQRICHNSKASQIHIVRSKCSEQLNPLQGSVDATVHDNGLLLTNLASHRSARIARDHQVVDSRRHNLRADGRRIETTCAAIVRKWRSATVNKGVN